MKNELNILQIFRGLVLDCIKTKFFNYLVVNMRLTAFFKLYKMCTLLHRLESKRKKTRKTIPLTPKTYSEEVGEKEAQEQRLAT